MTKARTRRDFVRLSAAAGTAAASAALLPFAPAFAQASPIMLTRPIPQSDEPLPVVGIGTWQTFDIAADATPRWTSARRCCACCSTPAARWSNSSPMYGRAEAVVGALLDDMKAHDKAFRATKVWTTGEAAGIRQMTESAAKMRGPIDLMQIHNLVDWRTHLRTLRGWKDQKRIRYIGLTHYTVPALDELAAIIATERVDFLQFAYSINVRAAETRLLPLAAERGVAVIINRPFDSGSLFKQRARQGATRMGVRVRVRHLEPVLSQVHPGPRGGDMRDPRHRQAGPRTRQRRRGHRPSAGRGSAQAHGRLLG